jgi:Glyoxalase-like domain
MRGYRAASARIVFYFPTYHGTTWVIFLRAPGGWGATAVEHRDGHTVVRDPEGNEFCVEPVPVGR